MDSKFNGPIFFQVFQNAMPDKICLISSSK